MALTTYTPLPDDPEFNMWYRHYPRKAARGDARKAWEQTKKTRPSLQRMLQILINQKALEQWQKEDGAFVPYPATYLRREQWTDIDEEEIGQVINGDVWWKTTSGIEAKAKSMGMEWDALHGETFQAFAERVKARVRDTKIVPIAGAA